MHVFKKSDGTRRNRRFVVLLLAGGMSVAGAGAAFAYWTSSGSGTGTANTGAPATVTVVQTSANTITAPGGSIILSGDFNNPNSGPTYVSGVTATVGVFSTIAKFAGDPPCTAADFTITGTSNTPGNVPAGSGVGTWSGLTLTLTNTLTNQDNCESLTTIPIIYTSA